jgi:uncharacterized protein
MIRRLLLGAVVAVMAISMAVAQPLGDTVRRAEQGDAYAQNILGNRYNYGLGVMQDHAEGARWYRKAADQGYAISQNNLGLMYLNGEGVPQDHAEAVRWFRKAAEQGLAQAQGWLGYMYYFGRGVPQDNVLAHMWFDLSAAQGIQNTLQSRDAIARQMTPDQIAEAQRLAREWKPNSR